ncbi:VQ motif-containing protein 22 [Spatholobus suberectus]|nr:VQ motif-containing protein 22 [Spatholobus suberectus]
MSDAISIPNDWLHFYQQSFPGEVIPSSVSDATTVTTTAMPAQLSPEGRVSKPIRRRSRASRRTPTTLLNTDTTNFRAMVQQFTGAPSAPDHLFGSRPLPVNPNGLMLAPSLSLQHQQHVYHQQHYTYTEGGDNAFFQRLSNPTPPNNVADRGGLFVDHGGRFFPTTSS